MEPRATLGTSLPEPGAAVWQLTLANGFRIWGETRPHSAPLAAHLVVGAGARHAARGQAGLPHFVEHLLFSGTERWPEARLHAVLQGKGHSPIFALDNLEESLAARLRDAKRLALLGLGAAAVNLIWHRVVRPGRQ